MLGVLVTILTVILVFISLLMALVILMQRPKQEGLGAAFGGALTDRMLGSGTTDFLQRSTVFMGVAFFVLSLTIATLMAYDRNADRLSQIQQVKEAAAAEAVPAPDAQPATDGSVPPVPVNAPEINVDEAPPVDDAATAPDEALTAPPLDTEAPPAEEATEEGDADSPAPADEN